MAQETISTPAQTALEKAASRGFTFRSLFKINGQLWQAGVSIPLGQVIRGEGDSPVAAIDDAIRNATLQHNTETRKFSPHKVIG